MKGAENAKVTLVEYSDFQCPACAAFFPYVEGILSAYPDDVRLVYRHFPLTSIHANAEEGAWASEAASKQGKFWEMYTLLFDRQKDWSNLAAPSEMFMAYADLLGLNKEQFKADYESAETRARVQTDVNSANRAGINSTPTFYLNGVALDNLRNGQDLADRVSDAINAANAGTNTTPGYVPAAE